MLKNAALTFFLALVIVSGVIATSSLIKPQSTFEVFAADSAPNANTQTQSQNNSPPASPAQAEAEIKKASDALAAAGLQGTAGRLLNTGEGYAKIFRDPKGAIVFIIFWTPSTGAHAVRGAIMQTYKSEGWFLSDLGYPTSDEKDLAGVTDGRYSEFEHGVIAMTKGKDAQVYATVQDAVTKLGQAPTTVGQTPPGGTEKPTSDETSPQPTSEGPAAIKAKSEELKTKGFSAILDPGTPEPALTKNKDGYYQFFNGGKYGIWWTKDTGAHEVHGPILVKWRELGFEFNGPGYPTDDEKDLPGVAGGRYSQFQKGVIAWTQAKGAQLFPNLDAAISSMKEPQIRQIASSTFKITFVGIVPHRCHDVDCEGLGALNTSNCAKWDMIGSVNGRGTVLMGAACVPGSGNWALDQSTIGGQFSRALFNNAPQGLGPYSIDVTIPDDGSFFIQANGRERDSCDHCPSPFPQIVQKSNSELNSHVTSQFGQQLTPNQKDVALYNNIFSIMKTGGTPAALQSLGATGSAANTASGFWGSSTPIVGQVIAIGSLLTDFVSLLGSNPDDGIGVIKVACARQNNYCQGLNFYASLFNGRDSDSTADYDLAINVQKVSQGEIPVPTGPLVVPGGVTPSVVPLAPPLSTPPAPPNQGGGLLGGLMCKITGKC